MRYAATGLGMLLLCGACESLLPAATCRSDDDCVEGRACLDGHCQDPAGVTGGDPAKTGSSSAGPAAGGTSAASSTSSVTARSSSAAAASSSALTLLSSSVFSVRSSGNATSAVTATSAPAAATSGAAPSSSTPCLHVCGSVCLPAGTCCDSGECGVNEQCASPGATCTCANGYHRCDGACIADGACCANPDDCGATRVCATGGACTCASGYRPCGAACIPAATCCDSGECTGGMTCAAPGTTCACPGGTKLCNGTCIASSSCCNAPDDCVSPRVCNGAGGACLCPGTVLDPSGEATATCTGGLSAPRVTFTWPSRGNNSLQKGECGAGTFWDWVPNNPHTPPWVDNGAFCGLQVGTTYSWRVKYDVSAASSPVSLTIDACTCSP